MKRKDLTLLLIATPIATICFFLLPPILANEFSSPVVTIAFDDGKVSQYQYAYPLMKARGITGTFYIISDLVRDISGNPKFMSFSEIRDLQNSGNEIGSHSCNHPSFTGLTEEEIRYECSESKNILEANDLTVENFAYPYGSTNAFVDSIVSEYYRSARTLYTSPYLMSLPTSQFRLTAFAGETGDSNALPRLKNELDQLTANQWLIIVFHSVQPNVSDKPYAISAQDFEEFLDYIALKSFETLTVSQTLDLCSSEDTAPPTISILSPENKTYAVKDAPLSFTVSETTSWIGYSLDGQTNVTVSGNTTLVSLSEGTHSITVYATDIAGNMGSSDAVYFIVDTVSVSIDLFSPQNKTYATDSVSLIFAVDEETSWMGYSLDGQANITITGDTTLTGLSDGMHSLVVYASDMVGNTGHSDTVHFTIDTTPPNITILSPENKTYAENDILLSCIVDKSVSWMSYSLDGQANVTITGDTTLTNLLDGLHYVVFYANDTVGNIGASTMIYFTVDTTPPNITDVSQIPIENNVQQDDEVNVNATVIDVVGGVERVALNYTNGNGTWVIIEMTSLSVHQNVWSTIIPSFPDGTNVTYIVIAEDDAGNTITSEELGYECQYQVIPEFTSFLIPSLLIIVTLLAVIVYAKKSKRNLKIIS